MQNEFYTFPYYLKLTFFSSQLYQSQFTITFKYTKISDKKSAILFCTICFTIGLL